MILATGMGNTGVAYCCLGADVGEGVFGNKKADTRVSACMVRDDRYQGSDVLPVIATRLSIH